MTLDIQFKLKTNPLYKQYLRQNPIWYKHLTRYPNSFKNFEEEIKDFYKLRPTDKINKMFEMVDLMSSFMSAMK